MSLQQIADAIDASQPLRLNTVRPDLIEFEGQQSRHSGLIRPDPYGSPGVRLTIHGPDGAEVFDDVFDPVSEIEKMVDIIDDFVEGVDRLVTLVEQGHDPALLVERVLRSMVGKPGEISVRRIGNASTDHYLGGTVLNAETAEFEGNSVIVWTIADRWAGRKISGV